MYEQTPGLAGRSHAWQVPPQRESQQSPSTQKALVHWRSETQADPFGRLFAAAPAGSATAQETIVCRLRVTTAESASWTSAPL
jgi:hypothetical protein